MAMKIRYDAEVDVVYMRMTDAGIVESEETDSGVIVDFDADGKVVGLEFLNAKEFFSAKAIEEFQKAA